MSAKAEKERRALEQLDGVSWANRLVATIRSRRPPPEGHLFELRFAQEIARAGITAKYEHETGVGGSSVDFAITNQGVTWNIELVSVGESDAVGRATSTVEMKGVLVQSLFLGHAGMRAGNQDDAVEAKRTPEHEMLRWVTKIEEKVYRNRDHSVPIKFPMPDGRTYNMILVDMRAYEGIGDPDRDHCRQIVGGPRIVGFPENVMWVPQSRVPVRGLWDPESPRPGGAVARQRIHVVAFVHEEDFGDDEIRETTIFFANPALKFDLNAYPLRWPAGPEGPRTLRRTRAALWNDG